MQVNEVATPPGLLLDAKPQHDPLEAIQVAVSKIASIMEGMAGNAPKSHSIAKIAGMLKRVVPKSTRKRKRYDSREPSRAVDDSVVDCVKKLFDADEYIGTITLVAERIAMCPFHCVLCGQEIKEGTLSIQPEGFKVRHIESFPFYDLSFYQVLAPAGLPYLTIDPTNLHTGTKISLLSFPVYENGRSRQTDLPLLCSEGVIARLEAIKGSPLVAAQYICFKGSSGGAVLSRNGRTLIGMHLESLYNESKYNGFSLQTATKAVSESECIKFPVLRWAGAKRTAQHFLTQKLKTTNTDTLATYASLNIEEKAYLGAFLPVDQIKYRLVGAVRFLDDILAAERPVAPLVRDEEFLDDAESS